MYLLTKYHLGSLVILIILITSRDSRTETRRDLSLSIKDQIVSFEIDRNDQDSKEIDLGSAVLSHLH